MGDRGRLSVLFLVAGGPDAGFGHVRRSWTLAAKLAADGVKTLFVASSAEAGAILARAGFSVSVEEHPNRLNRARGILRRMRPPRACVVDDPEVLAGDLATLGERAPVACIDDTCARSFPVDLVVNGSAGAEELPYRGAPDTRYLLGPRYVLLRNTFALEPLRPAPSNEVRRVLVLTGGGEASTVPRDIVVVIAAALPEAGIDLVTGPFRVSSVFDGPCPPQVSVHQYPDDLRSLMLGADLAVTGGGQTAYELAATSTPALGIRLAQNQAVNLRGLSAAGCLRDLGSPGDATFLQRLARSVLKLAHDPKARQTMGAAGRRLVDGRGTERVAASLQSLAGQRDQCDRELPRRG